MTQIIKDMNTIVYDRIYYSEKLNPNELKQYYDEQILEPIKSDELLSEKISEFFDLENYPSYLTDKIFEQILLEFTNQYISLEKLQYIEVLENVGNLTANNIETLVMTIITNQHKTKTIRPTPSKGTQPNIIFYTFNKINQSIKYVDKLKESKRFLQLIRFVLMNIYANYLIKIPEFLTKKILLYEAYGEIYMKRFINELMIEQKVINIDKSMNFYLEGLTSEDFENSQFELYYIGKSNIKTK